MSECQSRLLAHVYSCATRFARRHVGAASAAAECDDLLLAYSLTSLDTYATNTNVPLVPVVADRVSLPSSAGSAVLCDLLPPALKSQYESPNTSLFRDPSTIPTPIPRPAFGVSQAEYLLLIRRMQALGMLKFVLAPKVVNGLFGVRKDADMIRLIIDARPFNAICVDPPKVELPTPDILAELQVPQDSAFFVAKADLDNYYHRLLLPDWLVPYFALPPVRAADVGLSQLYGDVQLYQCCATLPMGWSHSVYLAQAAHEHLIQSQGLFANATPLTRESDRVLDRARFLVYIDDLVLLGPDADALADMQQRYLQAAADAGIPAKSAKVVSPSSAGVECLGLVVHGREHTVGVSSLKLRNLIRETMSLLAAGQCSGLQLARLVGKWTWASLVHRPLLSTFNAVYRFIQTADARTFEVWQSVRNELLCIVGLAPLMFASMNVYWFPKVIATDASETGLGVVAATVSQSDQFQLSSRPSVLPRDAFVSSTEDCVPFCATVSKWYTVIAAKWQRPEHINTLELRALTVAVKWVLSSPLSICRRLLVHCDSLVTLLSVAKGRSSSHSLLCPLRALAAHVLASGLRVSLKWIPTEINPADEPSRRL